MWRGRWRPRSRSRRTSTVIERRENGMVKVHFDVDDKEDWYNLADEQALGQLRYIHG